MKTPSRLFNNTLMKKTSKDKENTLVEVMSHYDAWTNDNMIRMTRKNGWNDVTDAYYGKLPDDWPFTSKTTDPRIRTALIEKNARLVNGKLRGRLVPREQGDVLKARIQNAIIDYQWDTANDGGSMLTKIGICDLDTRLYNSKFALIKWKQEWDEEGEIKFCGNEMTPLDIRDCGIDYAATHIRDAKWFQHRSFEYLEDLENQTDTSGKAIYQNLGDIKGKIKDSASGRKLPSQRKNEYVSRIKTLRGLEDRLGTDLAYPMVEVVTEYRSDRWITFCPQYATIIRDIENPYEHKRIPVAQLRYYPIQDDPLGENEVESVIPLWKAIQATVCGFMDEVILKIRPPLKVVEGQARIETIVYSPEAQWIVNSPDAVTEHVSAGEGIKYFQSSYSALVSAFNTAVGMMSQGVSGIDPFNPDKTATEVRATMAQQNARDQKNQNDLAEFIKDIIMMWVSNNKQFLFQDPKKKEFVMKIIGNDNFEYFKRAGLDETELPDESAQMISDIVAQRGGEMSDLEIQQMVEAGSIPKYPVIENPEEKDPEKIRMKPKMSINEMGDGADLYVTPEDLDGSFDYIADVKSMAMGTDIQMQQSRQEAIEMLTTRPNVVQLLQQQGWNVKIKDLLEANFEDKGFKDASRYFEKVTQTQEGNGQMGGAVPNSQVPGLPNVPQTNPGIGPEQQMAGAGAIPQFGSVPQGI